jgi:hypothetical protein
MVTQDTLFVTIKDFFERYYKELFIAGGCLLVVGLSIYFYSAYRITNQERAQLAFAQSIQEMKHSEKNPELWPNVSLAAKTAYRSHSDSAFAPYFLALESQAAARQSDNKEALAYAEQTIAHMSSSSPFYYLYKIRLALIKLDSDDVAIQTQGYNELKELAYDKNNPAADEALYYLGAYYKANNDETHVREAWQTLINNYPETAHTAVSPWAQLIIDRSKHAQQ